MVGRVQGVLLAGPDPVPLGTAAFALCSTSRRYVRWAALTTGDGEGTERTTERHLAELRSWAQVLVEHRRDGAAVVFDHERLRRIRDAGRVPVAVTDEPRVVDALLGEAPDWFAVLGAPSALRRPWARLADRFAVVVRLDRVSPVSVAHLVHHAAETHDETAH